MPMPEPEREMSKIGRRPNLSDAQPIHAEARTCHMCVRACCVRAHASACVRACGHGGSGSGGGGGGGARGGGRGGAGGGSCGGAGVAGGLGGGGGASGVVGDSVEKGASLGAGNAMRMQMPDQCHVYECERLIPQRTKLRMRVQAHVHAL
eukprot:627431-Pleurochrysis_carterae.AAC.1